MNDCDEFLAHYYYYYKVTARSVAAAEADDAAMKLEAGSYVFAKVVNRNLELYHQDARQPSRRPIVRPDGGERKYRVVG